MNKPPITVGHVGWSPDYKTPRGPLGPVALPRLVRLAPNDAARIPQPTYEDLWNAYVAGAKSGQKHPEATEHEINRAADAWCKLLHAERDPEGFAAMGQPNSKFPLPELGESP